MTSDRPYRVAMPALQAFEEIKRCSGTQFDPAVVEAFMKTSLVSSLKA
jgi:HD-GYP domain-containing protein (c-di-GMP phosphodiesterase class II)